MNMNISRRCLHVDRVARSLTRPFGMLPQGRAAYLTIPGRQRFGAPLLAIERAKATAAGSAT